MAEATTHSCAFLVETEQPAPGERWYTLGGVRHGPFATPEEAELHLLGRIERWQRRARALGGDVVRRTHREIIVTLPWNVPFEGGEGEEPAPWVRSSGSRCG